MKWSYEYVHQNENYDLYNHPTLHYAVLQGQSSLRFSDIAEELAVKRNPCMPQAATVQDPVVLRMNTCNGDTDWIVQCAIFLFLR